MAPMTMNSELSSILDNLIERWCDRRALGPLRLALVAYPATMSTSDEWHRLWAALRNVRGLNDIELPDPERQQVEQALRLVDRAIRAAGQVPTVPSA